MRRRPNFASKLPLVASRLALIWATGIGVALPGGAALPAWLTFNAETGRFSGTAPTGVKSVAIVLTATNSSGVKAAEVFAIQFQA